MNWDNYRKEMETLPISDDFEKRTVALLKKRDRTIAAKEKQMKFSSFGKIAAAIAATFAFSATAYAAVTLMAPAQVAIENAAPELAQSFAKEDAIKQQMQQAGEYNVTLEGITSGKNLTQWGWDGDTDVTYAVLAVQRSDGNPLSWDVPDPDSEEQLEAAVAEGQDQVVPLIGKDPENINGYTLGSAIQTYQKDGVVYYLIATQELSPYSGQKAYLAFYFGDYPDASMFDTSADGTMRFKDTFGSPHALFELPLK